MDVSRLTPESTHSRSHVLLSRVSDNYKTAMSETLKFNLEKICLLKVESSKECDQICAYEGGWVLHVEPVPGKRRFSS